MNRDIRHCSRIFTGYLGGNMIKFCTCKHEYQDKKYGKNKRVFNKLAPKSGQAQEYRCTVCGKVTT